MKILDRNQLFIETKKESFSLYQFCNSENNNIISENTKGSIVNWTRKINSIHHNSSDFVENFKEMFSINGMSQVIFGQEDIAGINHENIILIVRQAEMGVNFSVVGKIEDINVNNFKALEEIIEALDLGFKNPKNFHSKVLFDTIKEDLKENKEAKNSKFKL